MTLTKRSTKGSALTYTEMDNKGRLTKNIEYDLGSILSEYHILRDEDGVTEYHKQNGVLD